MRLLFFTDIHFAGSNPEHRVDDYPAATLAKLREVYEIAAREQVGAVVYGGDMFNTHKVYSYSLLNAVIDTIAAAPMFTLAICGQHDLLGYNRSSYGESALAFVARRCPRLQVLFDPVAVGDLFLVPCNPWNDVAEVMRQGPPSNPVNPGAIPILVAHALISETESNFGIIRTDTLPPSSFKLCLSGDLHCGFQPHVIGQTTFVNPGCLSRRRTDEATIVPKVAIIELDVNPPEVKYLKLTSAKPPEEVFGRTLAEELRGNLKFEAGTFAEALQGLQTKQVGVMDLVRQAAQAKKLGPEVVGYIETTRQNLATN